MAEQLSTDGDQAMRVLVEEVVFRAEDARYAVLRARGEGPNREVVLVGDLGGIAPGETLRVTGRWRTHAQYGPRFHVDGYAPITPSTREGIRRYLGSGLIPGIGPAMAERLVARFGERTLDVIAEAPARLREVSGIGHKRAGAIADAVRSRRDEAEALSYLQGLGLGPSLAKRVHRKYGSETTRVVRDDPYLVSEEISGIGFRTADRIGHALGYARDDPRRASGAVLHVIGQGADDGHTFLPRSEALAAVAALDVPEDRARDAIDVLAARGLVVADGDSVYAPPLHAAEVGAARRFAALARPRSPDARTESGVASGPDDRTTAEQRTAVRAVFEYGLVVITGGPGTGKTTTVRAIVEAHRRLERRIALCAPTGRAAKRLSEATGAPAQTIHRLLEYNPATNGFGRDASDPLRAYTVLVDEASMLDVQLAHRLLDAVAPTSTLVLVGDVDQLPPVGPGATLRELIESAVCPVVRLTEVFRQARESAIVRAAHDILHGRHPRPTPTGERGAGDLFLVRATEPEAITTRVIEALERVRLVYGFDPVRDVQVLTPMRRGALGTSGLNDALQRALNPRPAGAGAFRPRDKVMQLRNDYTREVFNGDLGEVARADAAGVIVDMGGRLVAYDRDALPALQLAYASTIHKVQGSEFPAVIVVLHRSHHVLLNRSLVYTAITRARRLVVIVGEERALARAIANASVQRTHSRLSERLRALVSRA
jgi:exodeoxyribonuclease V alpha subunit